MLKRDMLHNYQVRAVDFVKDKMHCGLLLKMGAGKTVSSATAASDLLDDYAVSRVLIIAPLRVCNNVWPDEFQEWEHLSHLKISLATGSAKQRTESVESDHDVLVINRENVYWLFKNFRCKWDMLIVDESSSFKSHKSQRFKALRAVRDRFHSIVLLTGTPVSNGYMDLWSQMFLVDKGQRLGKTLTNFRNRFFTKGGYMGYVYTLRKGADEEITKAISDVTMTMSKDEYPPKPNATGWINWVRMSDVNMDQYKKLQASAILRLQDETITAPTAATLSGKLLQFANGFLYDEDQAAHKIHDLKIEAMQGMVEDNPGERFLVAYNFIKDKEMLVSAFPKAVVLDKNPETVKSWNRGEIQMLICHPASAGHGLNLQSGGHNIVWYGMNWSLELYEQMNARLDRQGQKHPVRITHILNKGTMDEIVMEAIKAKVKTQEQLISFILRFTASNS